MYNPSWAPTIFSAWINCESLNLGHMLNAASFRASAMQRQSYYTNDTAATFGKDVDRMTLNQLTPLGTYSRKIFIGGLPRNESNYCISAAMLTEALSKLLDSCQPSPNGEMMLIKADSIEKKVQIRPWICKKKFWNNTTISSESFTSLERFTTFIGGVPRIVTAEQLAKTLMNKIGNVAIVEIETDRFTNYPKGTARVVFASREAYVISLARRLLTIDVPGSNKEIEIKPYLSDEFYCDRCRTKSGSKFCAELPCLKYFCNDCWDESHKFKDHQPMLCGSFYRGLEMIKMAEQSVVVEEPMVDDDFEGVLAEITEMEQNHERNKLIGMREVFPQLSEATIREHLHLDEEPLFLRLDELAKSITPKVEPAKDNSKVAPKPSYTAAEQVINPEEIQREMLKEKLLSKLRALEKKQQSEEEVQRTTIEETKISMFLRDAFPTIRQCAINEVMQKRGFYQCIIILRLVEMGYTDDLRKQKFIPNKLQMESESNAMRMKEANEKHNIQLPQMAIEKWTKYESMINADFLTAVLALTQFECPICLVTNADNDGIFCRNFDSNDKEYTAHLFCKDCVKQHAMTSVNEMTMGPGGSQIEPLLNADERELFDKRTTEAALAAVEDKAYCKRCNYAAIVEEPEKQPRFFCLKCNYKYCRLCGKNYDEKHEGRACEDVITAVDEARKRKEEELTAIVIRRCRCGVEFTKDGGCHMMTCRSCGQTQCYVCRQIGINHDHLRYCVQLSDAQILERDEQERINAINTGRGDALIKDQSKDYESTVEVELPLKIVFRGRRKFHVLKKRKVDGDLNLWHIDNAELGPWFSRLESLIEFYTGNQSHLNSIETERQQ
ncbi:unnamed protein product, partial [Mesorhabditis belari]|uniref:RING-type domain-containing protein n=1 Tax=Mesorhabditis belari TaxID=2138241 RepID=A0AAF3FAZ1_9BILA